MKRYIDMESYARREHFEYFNAMPNPYMGVTVELDVTDFLARLREKGLPFFASFLWCVMRAANGIPEFRRRIESGRIVEFDSCRSSHTVALPDGTYCYCALSADMPLDEYIPYARAEQERAASAPGLSDGEGDEALELCFISTLPWLSYTALLQPTPSPPDSNPRFTWGRYFERGGQWLLPFTVLANHALVDGLHLAQLLEGIKKYMDSV